MTMPEHHPQPVRRAFGRLLAQNQDGGPPDIDEMWRDFTRKLGRFFGFKGKGGEPGGNGGGGGGFQPDAKSAGIGAALVVGIVVVVWLFSGAFIVQEGQQAVVTTFGRYSRTVDAGWNWRLPYPFQAQQTVVTSGQTISIGGSGTSAITGLRDSAMLTQDENIVDVRFDVHFQVRDARAWLTQVNAPELSVRQAAESSVRELVGRSPIDPLLFDQHETLADDLVKGIQAQLDRIGAGVLVTAVNVESVSVPEQVAQALNDTAKAATDAEAAKTEGAAYAAEVLPKANAEAERLRADAEAYKARVVGAAQGDAERFKAVLAEYEKAPGVTRDRLYIDAMQEVYSNVTKVLVDGRGNNVIQLPLDKLAQAGAAAPAAAPASSPSASASPTSATAATATITVPATIDPPPATSDARSRDSSRSRDRDGR
jgi:modulator of FtsH protease HflK